MNGLLSYWSFNLVTTAALVVLPAVYLFLHHFRVKHTLLSFALAYATLIVCFTSPLKLLSDEYLFSAHMVVHMLLLLVVGPMLVLSLHNSPLINHKASISILKFFGEKPFIAWLAGEGIMWVWHIPAAFNSSMHAMHSGSGIISALPSLQNISIIVAGMLFSLPIVSPLQQYRLRPLSGVVYLFTACIACSLLGLLIVFAPTGLYNHFLSMHDSIGFNLIITNSWHITREADQQAAGLVMWVPCCLLYVVYSLILLTRWFAERESGSAFILPNH